MININIVNSDLYHIHYLLVSRCNSTFILIKSKKDGILWLFNFRKTLVVVSSHIIFNMLQTLNKAIL